MTPANAFGFSIPGAPEFVQKARDELAGFLTTAGLPREVVDDAVLAGSELVTNALIHSASGLAGGEVTVHAVVDPYGWAQVDVSDQGPVPAGATPEQHIARGAEGGLGLLLTAGVSSEIGDYTAPDGHHVTWFRLTWPTTAKEGRRDG